MSLAEFEPELRGLAGECGVALAIGAMPDGATKIGTPPADASLIRLADGRLGVHCHDMTEPRHFEQTLHELAHHLAGLQDEERCFELAAVWALRFPVEVSTEVAVMAKESLT